MTSGNSLLAGCPAEEWQEVGEREVIGSGMMECGMEEGADKGGGGGKEHHKTGREDTK